MGIILNKHKKRLNKSWNLKGQSCKKKSFFGNGPKHYNSCFSEYITVLKNENFILTKVVGRQESNTRF